MSQPKSVDVGKTMVVIARVESVVVVVGQTRPLAVSLVFMQQLLLPLWLVPEEAVAAVLTRPFNLLNLSSRPA